MGGRCEKFAQDQRHELALAGGESVKRVSLQVVRYDVIEPLFVCARYEFLHQSVPVRVVDVFEYLLSQRPFADRLEPLLELSEIRVPRPGQSGELGAETLQVAESEFINNAEESVQF